MLDGGGGVLSAAAQAAAEAARRAAEAARRAAMEAARRAAQEAAQRAAEQAAQRAQQQAARDTNQAQGQQRLTEGVQQTQEMTDAMPFETGSQPTPEAPSLAANTEATADLDIGGGRTRTSGGSGDGDLSVGAGDTGDAAVDAAVQVVEEASTTEVSASEQARIDRQERLAESGNDGQLIREHSNRARQLQTALEAMPPEQRQQFNEVREHARTAEEHHDIQSAVHELEQMAINRQLTPELTQQLHRISTQEMASTLTARDPHAQDRVLGETIRQIADVTSIQQDPKYETCGLNTLEQEFAAQNPEAYVKFIADMTSQDFRATLPGDPLSDPPQPWEGVPLNANQVEMPMATDRSLTSTLFQQSIRAAYATNGELAEDPISADQFNEIMNDMNPNTERMLVGISPDQQAAAMSEIRPGTMVVLANYDPTGTAKANSHASTVTAVEDGMVTLNDPYGKSYTLPVEDFQAELRGLVVDRSSSQVETDADGNQTIGGGRIRVSAAGAGDLSMGGGRTRFAAAAAGEL